MADVDALIDGLLSDSRLKTSRAFSERVFEDEPIIKRASQMGSYVPERYREMRAVGRGSGDQGWLHRASETERFVAQARFMADWEDDFPYHGQFNRYFPTYAMMNDQQLRGYFSWRTKLRRGQVEQAPLSFAFVHVYELLNGVGGIDAQACFDGLKAFWMAYRPFAPELNRYMRAWLRDFVVWHDLPPRLLADVVDLSFEEALIVLRREEAAVRGEDAPGPIVAGAEQDECSDARLYDALSRLSAYRIDRSAFAREHGDEVREVACAVFRALCRHCATRRKRTLIDSWFGMPYATPHLMFESAVVHMPKPHADCLYHVNAAHAYACRDGRWTALRQYRKPGRNAELGAVMQAVDRMMRVAWGDERTLQEREVPKYVAKAIAAAIDECRERMRRQEARTLVIDRSQLSGIRSRAADIREELLIDEERFDVAGEVVAAPALPDAVRGGAACATTVLSPEQARYVRALLEGADAHAALRAAGCTEDMMVDAVNEALFDALGDTALEYGENGPQVVDEYRQEVEGFVRP